MKLSAGEKAQLEAELAELRERETDLEAGIAQGRQNLEDAKAAQGADQQGTQPWQEVIAIERRLETLNSDLAQVTEQIKETKRKLNPSVVESAAAVCRECKWALVAIFFLMAVVIGLIYDNGKGSYLHNWLTAKQRPVQTAPADAGAKNDNKGLEIGLPPAPAQQPVVPVTPPAVADMPKQETPPVKIEPVTPAIVADKPMEPIVPPAKANENVEPGKTSMETKANDVKQVALDIKELQYAVKAQGGDIKTLREELNTLKEGNARAEKTLDETLDILHELKKELGPSPVR